MWFDRAVEPFAVLLLTADDPALQRCAPHDLQVASHEDDAALDHFLQVLEGLSLERHFVLLYELLSLGNARLALLPNDCPRVMATLLLRALPLADWREGGALVGLLALLAHQPLLSLEEAALTLTPDPTPRPNPNPNPDPDTNPNPNPKP